jgi:hypothetical protein
VGEKVVIESRDCGFGVEGSFTLRYDSREDGTQVTVHAWDRRSGDYAVYVELLELSGNENLSNIIVDRGQFVEGLLAAFPELQRKEQ